MNHAIGGTELIAAQDDGHAAGDFRQEQGFLAGSIAAADDKDLFTAKEHAVARRAIRNAATAIRILANKTSRSRRGTHASDNARGQRIAHIMMDRKQRRIRIVIDTRNHAPCNLCPQALCMLLKTLAEFGTTQGRNARIVLDLIGCGDLSSRHALLYHGRR